MITFVGIHAHGTRLIAGEVGCVQVGFVGGVGFAFRAVVAVLVAPGALQITEHACHPIRRISVPTQARLIACCP